MPLGIASLLNSTGLRWFDRKGPATTFLDKRALS